ncbi:MAG: hypothetical protein V4507_10790 [Verrucomicrobiota bacterium]
MKSILVFLIFILPVAAQNQYTKQFLLDENIVYRIPVAYSEGITTIFFPTQISGIRGQNISVNPENVTGSKFLLNYREGDTGYYFSLKALKEDATEVLSVIYQKKAYNLLLVSSPKPIYTATFLEGYGSSGAASKSTVSPARLVAILNKAKAYSLLSQYHPDAIVDISYSRPARIMKYNGFDVLIDEVFRFEQEDTIVFRVILRNNTAETIAYSPRSIAVRVADLLYPCSIADASGIIPPGTLLKEGSVIPNSTIAYFAITGRPDGGRNYLRVDNNWNILIPRTQPQRLEARAEPVPPHKSNEDELVGK